MFGQSRVCPKCGWEKPARAQDVETIEADLVKVRKSRHELALEGLDRREWYLMAVRWCEQHNKKAGMAYYRYQEKFGEKPERVWGFAESIEPNDRVSAYMRAGLIRYAKSNKRAA